MFGYCQKWLKISISVKTVCPLKTKIGFYFALFLPLFSVHHDCNMFTRCYENITLTEQIRAVSVIKSIETLEMISKHKIDTDIAACAPFVDFIR